jgi:hypothetical protein
MPVSTRAVQIFKKLSEPSIAEKLNQTPSIDEIWTKILPYAKKPVQNPYGKQQGTSKNQNKFRLAFWGKFNRF